MPDPLNDRRAMPSAFRDPKSMAEWIQLDYFRRPRGLRRWRPLIGWGTLAVFAIVVGIVLVLPRGKSAFQAGPVSSAHALINNRCEECHKGAFQTAKRLWSVSSGDIHAVPNEACSQCHDGPPHNANQLTEQSCASCHREHRGQQKLARVGDDHCTDCHADLKTNSRVASDTPYLNVSAFPDSHPEFRLWRDAIKDPGQLHFNHKLHLKPEGILAPGGKTELLVCANCHQQDAAGRYMQPIQYAAHCARCHPLSVQLAGPFADEKMRAAAAEFAKEPAPHKEPAIVRAMLRERLIRFVQQNPVESKPVSPGRPIPRPRRLEAITEQQWARAKGLLTEAEKLLFTNDQLPHNEGLLFDRAAGCAYCHVPAKDDSSQQHGPDGLPKYELTQLPARWLTHSRFGHDSHRMLACTECHAAPDSSKTSDVLMPHVDTCARCHHAKTGVRNDCVECHGYHHRDDGYEASKGWTIGASLGEK
jgi:hypothetical protein